MSERFLVVGDRLPSLELTSMDGQPFPLARLGGRRLVVFVWGSW